MQKNRRNKTNRNVLKNEKIDCSITDTDLAEDVLVDPESATDLRSEAGFSKDTLPSV